MMILLIIDKVRFTLCTIKIT